MTQGLHLAHRVSFLFVFLVFSFCMNVSLSWLPVCFCEHFAVLSLLTLPFPIIPHHERSAHAYSATPLDIIQMCMFFQIFSRFGHPPRNLLKKVGENTTQPRLENIISKQVSAWPLTFLFKPSNICLMQYFSRILHVQHKTKSFREVIQFCAVPLHKGVQHVFDMNAKSCSETAVQSSFR